MNEDSKAPVFEFDESETIKDGIIKEIMKTFDKTERTVFEMALKEFYQRELQGS